ncbi:MAG TPA: YsnF/AvaK domain-containing protein [Polyangiales bacterium]|nr:YsnF/AvaK domain-containing protein [Polyangiales bacterium]
MAKTVVGVFDEAEAAQKATRELQSSGIAQNHIRMTSNDEARTSQRDEGETSWTGRIIHFFESILENDEDKRHADTYAEAWRRGHYMVIADVDDAQLDQAVAIMNRYGTVDLDQRAEHWRRTGYTGSYDRSAAPYTPEQRAQELAALQQGSTQAVPVVQEELAIGKQLVQRGGVRIHSYVKEMPVEEVVRLREERVNVARRPVDRPASEADLAFQERTIDVTAQGEELVAEKRARVVEEVVVGKEMQEREEKVKDTVRRKDVAVEQVEGAKPKAPPAPSGASPAPRR